MVIYRLSIGDAVALRPHRRDSQHDDGFRRHGDTRRRRGGCHDRDSRHDCGFRHHHGSRRDADFRDPERGAIMTTSSDDLFEQIPHVDREWAGQAITEFALRDVSGANIGAAMAEVESHMAEHGGDCIEGAFGSTCVLNR